MCQFRDSMRNTLQLSPGDIVESQHEINFRYRKMNQIQ